MNEDDTVIMSLIHGNEELQVSYQDERSAKIITRIITKTTILGRLDNCNIQFIESGVSRQHAELFRTRKGWSIRDLDSANGTLLNGKLIKDIKIQKLQDIVNNGQIELKIAIPNSEGIADTFSERIGIFRDEDDQTVAFTGTSKESFSAQTRDFESVDVFTSWNDKSRVERKVKDFEDLWQNKTNHVEVYDFMYAEENNLLKYSSEWIMNN